MKLPAFFDAHVHLRQGDLLPLVAPFTDRFCSYCLVMPNIAPPANTPNRLLDYATEVRAIMNGCVPLFTFKISTSQDHSVIAQMATTAVAGKLYPEGVTTNSEDGVSRQDILEFSSGLQRVLGVMEDLNLVLCLHGELPGAFVMDREEEFLPFVEKVLHTFPKLRVVLEHVTTAAAINLVVKYPRLGCTITPHHLEITLDNVIGGHLDPHLFCKPIAKRPDDRHMLRWAATHAHALPNVFLGTDSAPHTTHSKLHNGCAGILNSPVAPEYLVTFFETAEAMDVLPHFAYYNPARFYRQPEESHREIELVRESWTVPDDLDGLTPWLAGGKLPWRLKCQDSR